MVLVFVDHTVDLQYRARSKPRICDFVQLFGRDGETRDFESGLRFEVMKSRGTPRIPKVLHDLGQSKLHVRSAFINSVWCERRTGHL